MCIFVTCAVSAVDYEIELKHLIFTSINLECRSNEAKVLRLGTAILFLISISSSD